MMVLPGVQCAGLETGLDHAEGGAVFDGAAGVEPFGFGAEFDVREVFADALEPQQRRVADAIDQGLAVVVRGRRDRRFGGGRVHGRRLGRGERGVPCVFWVRN